jgi:hypothetical protein
VSLTKRQLIDMAFEELGLAGYVFDITPEEQQSLVRRLDMMMATWGITGIRLGYNATQDPLNSDPDQDSGLPDWANEAVYLNLAVRSAASFGKNLARSTVSAAKMAYDTVNARCTVLADQPMQPMANLPIGAGYKSRWRPYVTPPLDLLTTGPDSLLDFNGPAPTGN